MAIVQKPDALSLSGNMKKFIVSSGSQIAFKLSDGATTLLEASYEPGPDGRAIIDVKDIVESRLSYIISHTNFYEQTNIVKTFTAIIDGSTVTFKVIRAGIANLSDTVSNWLRDNFLTWQPTNKQITYYSPEWLTYYAQEACNIKLKATFPDAEQIQITLGSCASGKAFTCNLQYAVVAGLLGQKYPTHFDVWVENTAGTRLTYIQRYLYSEPKSDLEQWYMFENSLGGLDTMRAGGDADFTGNHDHKLSSTDNISKEYQVDTNRSYNQNTGYLDGYERRWLLDFFPAIKKYIYHASAIRPIVVTESDVKYSASALPSSYNFTYRFTEDHEAALLNLIRNLNDIPASITIPNIDSPDFHLPPRLSEYPRVPLHEGVIIPAFDPNSSDPKVTTIGEILAIAISEVFQKIEAGEGGGELVNIIKLNSPEVPSDYNVFTSVRTLFEIEKYVNEHSSDKYLSKIYNDTAKGLITLLKGFKIPIQGRDYGVDADAMALLKHLTLVDGFNSEVFLPGIGGEGVRLRKKPETLNKWQLEIEDLIVNGKLSVNTVEVLEWKHVGAGQIYSHAGFKIEKVEELSDRYRVYPEKPELNTFQVNSQALCQQFNANSFESRRYWRLVIAVPDDRSFIDLSKIDAEAGSDVPHVGDNIFAYGYRGLNNALKGAIIVSSYGEDGPYIQTLRGIDSYDVSGKTQILIGNETYFKVDRFEIRSGDDWYRVPADKGFWKAGTYFYYDRVSWKGSLWLCVAQPSTTEEPNDTSIAWEKQVEKGDKGDDGETPIRVEKWNTPGYEMYREGVPYSATLAIKIFQGEADITSIINIARFVWMRLSTNEAGDEVWNDLHVNSGSSVDITEADLVGDTSFIVQLWDESKVTLLNTTTF